LKKARLSRAPSVSSPLPVVRCFLEYNRPRTTDNKNTLNCLNKTESSFNPRVKLKTHE